jgi:hypothetical protein
MTITTWRILWIPRGAARACLVSMAGDLGGREQQTEEEDGSEAAKRSRFKADAKLSAGSENGVRAV